MLDLRAQLYEHLSHMSLRFYTTTRPGDIITRLNNDVSGVQGLINVIVVTIFTNVITLATASVMIFAMDWRLALLAVVLIPLFVLPVRRVGRIRRALTRMTQEKDRISTVSSMRR